MQDDEVVVVPDDAEVQSAWPAWKHLLEDLADARPPPRSVLARRALRFQWGTSRASARRSGRIRCCCASCPAGGGSLPLLAHFCEPAAPLSAAR